MSMTLLTLEICFEQDVVLTRQRTRQIAELLGFDPQDQTRIATAVSEISRNAFQYAGGGKVVFALEQAQGIEKSVSAKLNQVLTITVTDKGSGIANISGILAGSYTSSTGIIGTKRLMDYFELESNPKGTTVQMAKNLPKRAPFVTNQRLGQIVDELIKRSPTSPFEEIQWQNQELLRALEALRQREEELTLLNQELEDTNRGVVSLYAELDEKADSLQRANELKTRFLSNMSHEFRTPLNSIISLSGMLIERMDGELTLEQEKQVNFIRKAAEGLSELVNDLLDLAKVEAGKIIVHPSHFEVSELFATLRGMLRPLLAHNSSIALIFDEPVDIAIYSDEGKVAQILRNFISNALKYTELGEVRVSVTRLDSNQITFAVKDTGIGIAPENQEKIFEEYIQIQSPLQKRTKGTGLGLPLSRKLAELLGGKVWLESELGAGATFYTSIPLICPNCTQDAVLIPTWQLDPNRRSVLVVEDSAETLLAYEKYLKDSCYQLIYVKTIKQAETAIASFQPDAIILDILLERENTWSFLAQLKENQTTQDLPILVTTVINNEHKALGLGANAFLIKPIDRWLLLNTLNKLVKGHRRQTLLLVDDDPVDRYLFKELVSDSLEIIEADNGTEGMKLAQMAQPNCIVLDLSLHNESGIDILNRLRSDPTTLKIPVIIQTSQVLEVEQQHLLAHSVAIISKERPNHDLAKILLQEALVKAGLFFETLGKDHA